MDDDTLDALLEQAAPPPLTYDTVILDELDALVRATQPASPPRRRRIPRSAAAGLVLAGTLGFAGAAAAGGYLPQAFSPWQRHALQSGDTCRMGFRVTEQTEPGLLGGRHVSQAEERATILAAQEFLDRLDVDSIDVDAAVATYLAARDRERAKVPPSEWSSETDDQVEIFAIHNAAFDLLSAELERQGLDPDVVNIASQYQCRETR